MVLYAGSSGSIDAEQLFKGLGTLEDLGQQVVQRLPDLVALVLWLPESEVK